MWAPSSKANAGPLAAPAANCPSGCDMTVPTKLRHAGGAVNRADWPSDHCIALASSWPLCRGPVALSAVQREREGQDGRGARQAQFAGDDRGSPSGVDDVVDEQDRVRRRAPATVRTVRQWGRTRRTGRGPAGRCCSGRSPAGCGGRTRATGPEPSEPSHRGDPGAERGHQRGRMPDGTVTTAAGRCCHRHVRSTSTTAANTSSGHRPVGHPVSTPPPRSRLTQRSVWRTASCGAASPATPSRSRSRNRGPQPISLSRPSARPGSACSAGSIRPDRGTPTAARPVGHMRRGSTSAPGLERSSRLAASAPGLTSSGQERPVQMSQRPHAVAPGSSSGGAGTPSGSCCRRYSRASPAARRPAPLRSGRTGQRRRPTAGRSRPSRPGPAAPLRRRREP